MSDVKKELNNLQKRRTIMGIVISDKMTKTIVVRVDRRIKHSLYKKYVTKSCRYKVHDEKNEAKIGDQVSLISSRPISREKRWVLQKIVRSATSLSETE